MSANAREYVKLLLEKRGQILNQFRNAHQELVDFSHHKGTGDEADQTVQILTEQRLLSTKDRLLKLIVEIDYALSKIESGTYGVCEETQEPIEQERLKAIPWTRYSIEGAEIIETKVRRFKA